MSVKPNIKPLSEWSDDELRVKVAELCGLNPVIPPFRPSTRQ